MDLRFQFHLIDLLDSSATAINLGRKRSIEIAHGWPTGRLPPYR
jgi:hypothetical protein